MTPRILRLNRAGQPLEWLDWRQAVGLYSRELVVWSFGQVVQTVFGGYNRVTGRRSMMQLPSIIACGGQLSARQRSPCPLSNNALFARDRYICLYCAREFPASQLTRDHIQPLSRGGQDVWENVVAACRRCNQQKADSLLDEMSVELVALPYRPNRAEYLALINSRRILGDQMEFLRTRFSKHSRCSR